MTNLILISNNLGRLKNTSFFKYLSSPKISRSNLFHFKEKNCVLLTIIYFEVYHILDI